MGVESRTGAVTVVSRWLFDLAFAASPQSGLAWFCFLFPLIEPDWQISRIRLSEKTHAFAHGWFAVRCGNWTKPYTECRDASGNRLHAGRALCVCRITIGKSAARPRTQAKTIIRQVVENMIRKKEIRLPLTNGRLAARVSESVGPPRKSISTQSAILRFQGESCRRQRDLPTRFAALLKVTRGTETPFSKFLRTSTPRRQQRGRSRTRTVFGNWSCTSRPGTARCAAVLRVRPST